MRRKDIGALLIGIGLCIFIFYAVFPLLGIEFNIDEVVRPWLYKTYNIEIETDRALVVCGFRNFDVTFEDAITDDSQITQDNRLFKFVPCFMGTGGVDVKFVMDIPQAGYKYTSGRIKFCGKNIVTESRKFKYDPETMPSCMNWVAKLVDANDMSNVVKIREGRVCFQR